MQQVHVSQTSDLEKAFRLADTSMKHFSYHLWFPLIICFWYQIMDTVWLTAPLRCWMFSCAWRLALVRWSTSDLLMDSVPLSSTHRSLCSSRSRNSLLILCACVRKAGGHYCMVNLHCFSLGSISHKCMRLSACLCGYSNLDVFITSVSTHWSFVSCRNWQ